MKLHRLVPAGPQLDLDDRDALLAHYRPPRPRWLRLNLVSTLDGRAAGEDGTSETLTSRADRRILGVIRELADAVLVGAASVRLEGYQLPKRAPLAVVTRSGDLTGHRLTDPADVLVLGPESARAHAQRTLGGQFAAVGDDPAAIVGELRRRSWSSVVCEGGPTLATQLLAAGLVDELCLTTTPRLGGAPMPLLAPGLDPTGLRLRGLLADGDGALFARWAVTR